MRPEKAFPVWMAADRSDRPPSRRHKGRRRRHLLAAVGLVFSGIVNAALVFPGPPTTAVPSYLADGSYLWGITVSLEPGQFLLPVRVSGASDLQTWQWDLHFDRAVVGAIDPGDGSAGIYGAEFTPGDTTTLAFILGGFVLPGLVDDVAGAYPSLSAGPSGEGWLAYVRFGFLPGQESGDPGFRIDDLPPMPVPEPGTGALMVAALVAAHLQRRRRHTGAAALTFNRRGDRP